MTTTIYGIKNCDTVKKARRWLDTHGVVYKFHDYKKCGIDRELLEVWCQDVGWQALLNKRSTTWRNLSEADKTDLNQTKAIELMQNSSSLIKRPVLVVSPHECDAVRLVGFDEARYTEVCGK